MDRQIVLKALVGSENYNLNVIGEHKTKTGVIIPASDKDYKVFVLPTFEDLYKGRMYSEQVIGIEEDLGFHDIRKMVDVFYKSNINFLEVLYSKELIIPDELNRAQKDLINKLLSYKKEIVKMNLPYLFNACGGMYSNKMLDVINGVGTKGTQNLIEAFGYDCKNALHAYRVIDFAVRFAETEFEDFESAIRYDSKERDFMLDIKHGFFTLESFENFITFYHDAKFKKIKDKYHSVKPNEELKLEIEDIIMQLVKVSLT